MQYIIIKLDNKNSLIINKSYKTFQETVKNIAKQLNKHKRKILSANCSATGRITLAYKLYKSDIKDLVKNNLGIVLFYIKYSDIVLKINVTKEIIEILFMKDEIDKYKNVIYIGDSPSTESCTEFIDYLTLFKMNLSKNDYLLEANFIIRLIIINLDKNMNLAVEKIKYKDANKQYILKSILIG